MLGERGGMSFGLHIQSGERILEHDFQIRGHPAAECVVADLLHSPGDRGEQASWRRFLRTFRQELVTATIVTVIWGAALLGMVWILRVLWAGGLADIGGARMAAAAYFVLLLIPVGTFCWMFPLLSRFTFRPGGLMATGLRITMGYLPYTLVIVLIGLAAALAAWALVVLALVLPCVTALAWSLVMERVFRKYMPAEPDTPETPEDPELPEE